MEEHPLSWNGRLNIVNKATLPNWSTYSMQFLSKSQLPFFFSAEIDVHPEIHMKLQDDKNPESKLPHIPLLENNLIEILPAVQICSDIRPLLPLPFGPS